MMRDERERHDLTPTPSSAHPFPFPLPPPGRATPTKELTKSQSQPLSSFHRRAVTVMEREKGGSPRGASQDYPVVARDSSSGAGLSASATMSRHERRSSTGAGSAAVAFAGTLGVGRRPRTAGAANAFASPGGAAGGANLNRHTTVGTVRNSGEGWFGQTAEEDEEQLERALADKADGGGRAGRETDDSARMTDDEGPSNGGSGRDEDFKPVYLKGLFRCVLLLFRESSFDRLLV